jgi:FtsZ-interacting cell division protein ZipA
MISDFQLVLVGIIAVIIVGVIIYNRWQEAKYKKQAQSVFAESANRRGDALFNADAAAPPSAGGRREPTFGAADEDVAALEALAAPMGGADEMAALNALTEPRPVVHGANAGMAPAVNPEIDTIAMMLADTPVEADAYAPMVSESATLAKNILWEGLVGGLWQPIDATLDEKYREIRCGLQLADRSGPIDASLLSAFDDLMGAFAERLNAVSQRESVVDAERRAQMVDQFCAETDIEIAVNLIGKSGVTFATTKVRGLAESQGLVMQANGEYAMQDDYGRVLFTLRNGNPAEAPAIRTNLPYLTQITFALDVPRSPQPSQMFERMYTLALQFADVLQGELVDDNKKLLTANSRKVIAETIHGITGEMQQRGVTPGSSVALRLYS